MPHFNIQVSIQKVEEAVTTRTAAGVFASSGKVERERTVTKLADVAITADTEAEAFSKAYRLLDALKPEPVVSAG